MVKDGFTSKQVEAFSTFAEAVDAFLQAFAEDYEEQANLVDELAQELTKWANS